MSHTDRAVATASSRMLVANPGCDAPWKIVSLPPSGVHVQHGSPSSMPFVIPSPSLSCMHSSFVHWYPVLLSASPNGFSGRLPPMQLLCPTPAQFGALFSHPATPGGHATLFPFGMCAASMGNAVTTATDDDKDDNVSITIIIIVVVITTTPSRVVVIIVTYNYNEWYDGGRPVTPCWQSVWQPGGFLCQETTGSGARSVTCFRTRDMHRLLVIGRKRTIPIFSPKRKRSSRIQHQGPIQWWVPRSPTQTQTLTLPPLKTLIPRMDWRIRPGMDVPKRDRRDRTARKEDPDQGIHLLVGHVPTPFP